MTNEDMLAALLAQARTEGAELVTLRAIAEDAGELGANRALVRIGLSDEAASGDIDELRELRGQLAMVVNGVRPPLLQAFD